MPTAVRLVMLVIAAAILVGRGASPASAAVFKQATTQPTTGPSEKPPATQPAVEAPADPPVKPAPPATADMSHFDWMIGTWKGQGWVMLVPGQREGFSITQVAESRLDGQVLLIDGYGTTTDEDGTVRPVHQAFVVISFDAQEQNFSLRTIRKGTGQLDPSFQLIPGGGFDWSFEIVAGERKAITRYTVRRLEDGRWQEKGFLSLDDGKTWAQFFELTLTHADDAVDPATAPATTTAPATVPTPPASRPASQPVPATADQPEPPASRPTTQPANP